MTKTCQRLSPSKSKTTLLKTWLLSLNCRNACSSRMGKVKEGDMKFSFWVECKGMEPSRSGTNIVTLLLPGSLVGTAFAFHRSNVPTCSPCALSQKSVITVVCNRIKGLQLRGAVKVGTKCATVAPVPGEGPHSSVVPLAAVPQTTSPSYRSPAVPNLWTQGQAGWGVKGMKDKILPFPFLIHMFFLLHLCAAMFFFCCEDKKKQPWWCIILFPPVTDWLPWQSLHTKSFSSECSFGILSLPQFICFLWSTHMASKQYSKSHLQANELFPRASVSHPFEEKV